MCTAFLRERSHRSAHAYTELVLVFLVAVVVSLSFVRSLLSLFVRCFLCSSSLLSLFVRCFLCSSLLSLFVASFVASFVVRLRLRPLPFVFRRLLFFVVLCRRCHCSFRVVIMRRRCFHCLSVRSLFVRCSSLSVVVVVVVVPGRCSSLFVVVVVVVVPGRGCGRGRRCADAGNP